MLVSEKRELFMRNKSAYAKRTHDYGAAAVEVCVLVESPNSLTRNRQALTASITTCSLRVKWFGRLISSIRSGLGSLLRALTKTYYGRVTFTRDTSACYVPSYPASVRRAPSCARSIFVASRERVWQLRLVSRDWNVASTPFVFDNIKLRPFPSSVEKFDKLYHLELTKHVRTLDFYPDLLPVWDKETWLSNVR